MLRPNHMKEHTVQDPETMGVENEEDVEVGVMWCVYNLPGRNYGKWGNLRQRPGTETRYGCT
jgi:hypothetical protein